jgi:hypothetical protein
MGSSLIAKILESIAAQLGRRFASLPCITLSPTVQSKEPMVNFLNYKEVSFRSEEREVG